MNILNDHTTDELSKLSETDKMILFVPDFFWASIIEFEFHKLIRAKLFEAWWKYLRRLSVGNKSWMLLMMSIVMMIRMPEAYAVNVTVKSTSMSALTTSIHKAVVMPTADFVSLMKGKKPISIPENEVVTSEDTEDYLEDSEEDYDAMIRKENSSGELFFIFSFLVSLSVI